MDNKLIQCIEGYKRKRNMNHKREIQWLGSFFELIAYKEKNNNTDVPSYPLGKYKTLGGWVLTQRSLYNSKAIDPAREELLKMVGFNFRLIVEWDAMFEKLVKFKEEFGHTNVSSSSIGEYKTLSKWVQRQRAVYTSKAIDPEREKLLKQIGFSFRLASPPLDWDTMFNKILLFKEEFGHCNIIASFKDHQLYQWILKQKQLYWSGKLNEEKYNRFISAGVNMQKQRFNIWDKMYEQLVNFKEKHGHLYVCGHLTNNQQLTRYVAWLRNYRNNLSEEKIRSLDSIGFIWKPGNHALKMVKSAESNTTWLKHYEELKAYTVKNGHSHVTRSSKEYPLLYRWTLRQKRHKNLPEERRRLLDKIGFFENRRLILWNKKFELLVNFKEQYGHLRVCSHYNANRQLINFVNYTRMHKNELSPDQIKRLDSIQFIWKPDNVLQIMLTRQCNYSKWLKQYEALVAYKEKHGNCRLTQYNKKYPKLGKWADRQRFNPNLSEEKRKLLDKLGFFEKKQLEAKGKS